MSKIEEKAIAEIFLEYYNKNNNRDLKIDRTYLDNRPENEFPDIKLIENGKQPSDIQLEITGVHEFTKEIVKQRIVIKDIEKRLEKEKINHKCIIINANVLPPIKVINNYINELIAIVKKSNDAKAELAFKRGDSDQYPIINKYSKSVEIKASGKTYSWVMYASDLRQSNICSIIYEAIVSKESMYPPEEKEKTILLLQDKTVLASEKEIQGFTEGDYLSKTKFKGIYWVDHNKNQLIIIK